MHDSMEGENALVSFTDERSMELYQGEYDYTGKCKKQQRKASSTAYFTSTRGEDVLSLCFTTSYIFP
jgi:hypothetical protein